VKLLLDTHVLLWAIDRPTLLSKRAKQAITSEANELYASVVSLWEIALKVQTGKLSLPATPAYFESNLRKAGIRGYVPISLTHVYEMMSLPPVHKDPFDRMLVAQANAESMTLVSKDEILSEYPVKVFW
jgi:PIN domain nuclease of toxin-antitoxin system